MRRSWTRNGTFTYLTAMRKNNNSQTKQFNRQEKQYTKPYPIKPARNAIPKDLNLQNIFTMMLKSSEELSKYYSFSIKNSNMGTRKIILKQIRDYFLLNNIDYKIYFKSILLFDILSIENINKKMLNSVEEIALGALILSIKFNYVENNMFSMKKFLQFFGENAYSLTNIFEIERNALKAINYYLNYTTPMCFLEFFMLNGIIYDTDYLSQNESYKIYNDIVNVLEKIMVDSDDYLKYNFFYLACSVVSYCRYILNLEVWPLSLKNVFTVDVRNFQTVYNKFFGMKENNNYYMEPVKKTKTYNNPKYNFNQSIYEYNSKDIIINGNNNVVLLDFKNLNNSIKSYKTNNFSIYRKNNNKSVNHYNNNIINININNVSLNRIYNENNNNIFSSNKEININRNYNTNIFRYNINSNSVSKYSENKRRNYNDIYRKSLSKNKYENNENTKTNDYKFNLESNLNEIKEVKDFVEPATYVSPQKRKRKHYYVIKRDNNDKDENNINSNLNQECKENDNKNKNSQKNTINREESRKSYKRVHFKIKSNNYLSNIEDNDYNTNDKIDNKNNEDNEVNDNDKINSDQNIEQNSNENSTNAEEGKDNVKLNIGIKYDIKNYKTYKQDNTIESNLKNQEIISKNIILEEVKNLEKKEDKTENKCESSRISKYDPQNNKSLNSLFYTETKEKNRNRNRHNDIVLNNEKRNTISQFTIDNEKEKAKNKKHKIHNNIKYNDLIKYKLALSNSINKRK